MSEANPRRRAAFVPAAILLTAAVCAGVLGYAGAQVLSGSTLSLLLPTFDAGGTGTALSGGTMTLTHSIGDMAFAPLSGGTLQLTPGVVGAVAAAQADLGTLHAFPTPFRPRLGHDRITFRGLTVNATIKIYTLSGELVQTLTKSDPATQDLIWFPVANSAGQAVVSGVYFYVVDGDSGRKTGKLMIIR